MHIFKKETRDRKVCLNFKTGVWCVMLTLKLSDITRVVITFLNRKNSGVQTAPKSFATSCDCKKNIKLKKFEQVRCETDCKIFK